MNNSRYLDLLAERVAALLRGRPHAERAGAMRELGRWLEESGTMERAPRPKPGDTEQWAIELLNKDSRVKGRLAELRIFASADWPVHPARFESLDEIGFAFQPSKWD